MILIRKYYKLLCIQSICIFLLPSCYSPDQILRKQLKNNSRLSEIVFNPEYEVQIMYTRVDTKTGKTETSFFKTDTSTYFYPASTVKMPVAFLALEKVRKLQKQGFPITPETTMHHGSGTTPQTEKTSEETVANGSPNIKRYIEKIFLVSDNDAYNRLFEFLGQDSINKILKYKNIFTSSVINHRLGVPEFDFDDNRRSNPISFSEEGKIVYTLPERFGVENFVHHATNSVKGRGYIDQENNLVKTPFDFSKKNYYNLVDMQNSLARVIHPEWFSKQEQFDVLPEDYIFLKETMQKKPRDDRYYAQDTSLHDNYVKFFIFGDCSEPIPDHVKIYNKTGMAYGYLIDCSYIEDTSNNTSFYLTAMIHVNKNQIYNDGIYEYKTIGIPFLAELGRTMYLYTKKKSR